MRIGFCYAAYVAYRHIAEVSPDANNVRLPH